VFGVRRAFSDAVSDGTELFRAVASESVAARRCVGHGPAWVEPEQTQCQDGRAQGEYGELSDAHHSGHVDGGFRGFRGAGRELGLAPIGTATARQAGKGVPGPAVGRGPGIRSLNSRNTS
jgi:hypothetical protein